MDKKIGIIMATFLEAKPFIEGLGLSQCTEKPFRTYKSEDFILIISGIGKANASMASVYFFLTFNPISVFNLGAAGAVIESFLLGKFYHVSLAVEYDRPSFKTGKPYIYTPSVLSGFDLARIATQDKAVLDPLKRKEVSLIADLVDMESASVIYACKKFGLQCYIFKFVSDTIDHVSDNDIVTNINKYSDNFFRFFNDLVIPVYISNLKL